MGMFDKPAVVKPATPAKPKSKYKEQVEIRGIEHLAMIDALQKSLETLRGTIEGEVKDVAREKFAEHVQLTGQRPESFEGVEGGAKVTLTMSRKASTTALSEAHAALLIEHGVQPEKLVVTPELFAINPAYAGDKALLSKVEKALAKIVPADFIQIQEEKSKQVVTEAVFMKAIQAKVPAEVLQTISSVSASPKLNTTDLPAILEFVRDELLGAPAFGAAAEEAKQSKGKKLKVVAA